MADCKNLHVLSIKVHNLGLDKRNGDAIIGSQVVPLTAKGRISCNAGGFVIWPYRVISASDTLLLRLYPLPPLTCVNLRLMCYLKLLLYDEAYVHALSFTICLVLSSGR